MKKSTFNICILFLSISTIIQAQEPIFYNFNANQTWLNPAFAGSSGSFRIIADYKKMWSGIPNSPMDGFFAIDAAFGKGKIRHGAGLESSVASVGADARSYIKMNYSITVPACKQKGRFAVGISAGLVKYREFPTNYVQQFQYLMRPTFALGALYYSPNSWLSLGVSNAPFYFRNATSFSTKMLPKITFGAGRMFNLCKTNPAFKLAESITSTQISIGFMVRENTEFWLKNFITGLGFGLNNPSVTEAPFSSFLTGTLGYQGLGRVQARYTYLYQPSSLRGYTYGTHEISIALLLGKPKTDITNPWMIHGNAAKCRKHKNARAVE